jgi:hypothetical protein
VRVLHVEALAERRGPAAAASLIYREAGMSSAKDETP